MLGIVLVVAIIHANVSDDYQPYKNPENWKTELTEKRDKLVEEINKLEEKLAESDVDAEEMSDQMREENSQLAEKQEDLKFYNYRLEKNIKEVGIHNYLISCISTAILFITIMPIIIAAGIVAEEFTTGTIKLLMVRPIGRMKILLSKYLAVIVTTAVFILATIVFYFIVGAIFFGVDGIGDTYLYMVNEKIKEIDFFEYFNQKFLNALIYPLISVTIAFMVSTLLRRSGLALALALFVQLGGELISGYLVEEKYSWAKYILFTNTSLNWYIDGTKPPLKGMTIEFSITMLIIYYLILLAVAFISFEKRDIAT